MRTSCLRAGFTGWVYGQNNVLQPYDLPVTRGEGCARAWVLRQLITDCARRGSRLCAPPTHGWRCSAPTPGSSGRHLENCRPEWRHPCRLPAPEDSSQAKVRRSPTSRWSIPINSPTHRVAQVHSQSSPRPHVSGRQHCRRTTQHRSALRIAQSSSLLDMRIPILLRLAIANLLKT